MTEREQVAFYLRMHARRNDTLCKQVYFYKRDDEPLLRRIHLGHDLDRSGQLSSRSQTNALTFRRACAV